MATKTGIGYSIHANSYHAGAEAAFIAMRQLQEQAPHFVLCFCNGRHNPHEFLAGVRLQTGDAPLLGGAALGVFTNNRLHYKCFEANVAVFASDTIAFQTFAARSINLDYVQKACTVATSSITFIVPEHTPLMFTAAPANFRQATR